MIESDRLRTVLEGLLVPTDSVALKAANQTGTNFLVSFVSWSRANWRWCTACTCWFRRCPGWSTSTCWRSDLASGWTSPTGALEVSGWLHWSRTVSSRLAPSMARPLFLRPDLVVAAGGVNSALALCQDGETNLVHFGGCLSRVKQGMTGPCADAVMDMVHADHAFLGAEGVSYVFGISCVTHDQAFLKCGRIRSINPAYLIGYHSGIYRPPFSYWRSRVGAVVLAANAGVRSKRLTKPEAFSGSTMAPADAVLVN